jgi:hypothetical protein
MFDPERDEDHDSRRFLWRLLVTAVVTVVACAVLLPSVTGFAAGPDQQVGCLAIKDGWHRDRTMSDDQQLAAFAAMPKALTLEEMQDPAAVARFREQFKAAQERPEVKRAYAAMDWADGPGACVRASRHRLMVSGVGLGVLVLSVVVVASFNRARRGSRLHAPAIGRSPM